MKSKDLLIKKFIFLLLVISIIWELVMFITTSNYQLAALPKQLLLWAALFWMIAILFDYKQDNDDWAY